jgi:hypothetical protein
LSLHRLNYIFITREHSLGLPIIHFVDYAGFKPAYQ